MIIYFSGSGNSLAIARQLSTGTNDTLIHLNQAVEQDLQKEKVVGLVYPAYSWDAPLLVKSLVPKLNLHPDTYVYIVVTCGSTPGNAIPTVLDLLAQHHVTVQYSRILSMPDSSAICFGNNANGQFDKLEKIPSEVDGIISDITQRKRSLTRNKRVLQASFINSRLFFPIATRLVRQYVNQEKCIGSGLCAKLCPCGNIEIVDGKAHVGPNCTQCLGCVHFCPHQALEIRHKSCPKSLQYHHPSISPKDLTGNGLAWEKK